MDSTALIKVQNLVKDYKTGDVVTHVLKGLSFEIKKGEFVSIMGPSGSGKSTLMHVLGFLDRLSSGSYHFEGRDVSKFADDQLAQLRNKSIGFVFQSYNLLPKTTVLDNVVLPLVYTNLSSKKRYEKAKQSIEAVGLSHRLNYYSNQLSGGEQQRVAIARALVNDPTVVFADEPTGNLDSKSGQQVMEIIQTLNSKGNTIILVTHEQDTAEHAQRILFIKDGLIEKDTTSHKQRFASHGELRK